MRLLVGLVCWLPACLWGDNPGFHGDGTGGGSSAEATTDAPATDASSESGSETGDTPEPIELGPVGYEARPCGFDLDHDGIPGEPEDDCTICDGAATVARDDGLADVVQHYIDCDAGSDDPDCGTSDNPCHAFMRPLGFGGESLPSGEQHVMCFRGTCATPNIETNNGWEEPTVTRETSGSEAIPFEYSAVPAIVAGWDSNGNGEYPPHDDGDPPAILQLGSGRTISFGGPNTPGWSHDLEFAHFEVQGGFAPGETLIRATRRDKAVERVLLHDIEVRDAQVGQAPMVGTPIVDLELEPYEGVATQVRYLSFENVLFDGIGGYIMSGDTTAGGPVQGPIRFKNVTVRWSGTDGTTATFWRSLGRFEDVEIIDSIFDADVGTWTPHVGTGPHDGNLPSTAIRLSACHEGVTVRNNRFAGYSTAVLVQSDTESCGTPLRGLTVEGNLVDGPPFPLSTAAVAFAVEGEVGDVGIVNNVVTATDGWLACASLMIADGGPVRFDHNTCVGEVDSAATGGARFNVRPLNDMTPGAVRLRNNAFVGGGGDLVVFMPLPPADFVADHNVYPSDGRFRWQGAESDLAGWTASSNVDDGSRTCTPSLLTDGDFHLAPDDTCARDQGGAVPAVNHDIDGDVRDGMPDIGADEAVAD